MMPRVLDTASAQMGIILMILRRDTSKRLVVSALISCAVGHFAGWQWGAASAAVLLLNDLAFYLLFRKTTDPLAPATEAKTIATIVYVSFSMLPYTFPGILMMAQPVQAAQVLGLFWICASLVYILAIYSMTMILGWSTILVHSLGLVAGIAMLHPGPVAPMTPVDMSVLAFFTVLWLWNTYEFMNASANNRRAFGEARFQAEERLKQLNFLVNHDHLTGLMNRRAFDEALSDVLLTREPSEHLAVVLIDLDGFKPVNDTYGHAAGDAVLVAVGERLSELAGLCSPTRLGGDEFMTLVPSVPPAELPELLEKVSAELSAPVEFEGTYLSVGASMGYAFAQPGSSVSMLIAGADAAMYDDKQRRKLNRSTVPSSRVARMGSDASR